MTRDEEDLMVAEARRRLQEYMASDEFAGRCLAVNARHDAGEVLTDAQMALALRVPEAFISVAIKRQAALLSIPEAGIEGSIQ